jgi:hypothetical protein
MSGTRQNSGIINFDTIVIVLILFFGLLYYSDYAGSFNAKREKPVESTVSVAENFALSTPIVRLQIYQKTWISNKDNFSLLAFNRNPLHENKITNLRVSELRSIRQSHPVVPRFILRYHLFPREMDELPLLG